jgi:hypothetical protein
MFNCIKLILMKRNSLPATLFFIVVLCLQLPAQGQTRTVKKGAKYDTIIVKHVTKPAKKAIAKPVVKQEIAIKPEIPVKKEIILPIPEFINQPYYYDKDSNKLIRLENASALMVTKKKTLGLKGAKQSLTMDAASSKIRFTAKKEIVFFIKTSGDVIDLTSYIKLYQFVPADQKREVTINAKEGLLTNKDEAKGKLLSFSVKMISPDNYMIQLPQELEAGEYGFVWVKNMELKEFTVFSFGIDWKSSD